MPSFYQPVESSKVHFHLHGARSEVNISIFKRLTLR